MMMKNVFMIPGIIAVLLTVTVILGLPTDLTLAQNKGLSDTGNALAGKAIFEDQCEVCRTIGGGSASGPDLKGVREKRSHQWLVEFIQDPDKLFEKKDPTGEKLLNDYAGVKMPNMGLTEKQVNDVLAYIRKQSQ